MNKKVVYGIVIAIVAIIVIVAIIIGTMFIAKNGNVSKNELGANQENMVAEIEGAVEKDKVYYVGQNMKAGTYEITCAKTNYGNGMDIVIFKSEDDYKKFENAEKYTVGEFGEAVRDYSWANFYLNEGDKGHIGLKDGYIVFYTGGKCDFRQYDFNSSNMIYSGIYVVGEDTKSEKYNIRCTSNYMKVTLFANEGKYIEYLRETRTTVGEEGNAIEKYATATKMLSKDNEITVSLPIGAIMKIEDGNGEYSVEKNAQTSTNTSNKNTQSTSNTTIGNTQTSNLDSNTNSDSGISKEFKEAMDSYEKFMDEYVAFMKKYTTSNGTDMSLISDYSRYITQYADVNKKFAEWESKEMSIDEKAYYIDVQARVSKKLLEVAE